MDAELQRAYDFILRADMVGTRHEPCQHGLGVVHPELPLRHDSNYLLVDTPAPGTSAATYIEAAERLQGAAGLAHRSVMFRDGPAAARLASDFAAAGWEAFHGVIMAWRRPPDTAVDTSSVERTDDDTLRAARTANILRYPWCTPAVAEQLLGARAYSPVEDEVYAVFADGEPVAWAELYQEGDVAQVESVATEPAFRRRGHASAIVTHLVEVARARGARLVFLCADAEDRPQALYRRLGFEPIGSYRKFSRPPPRASGQAPDLGEAP